MPARPHRTVDRVTGILDTPLFARDGRLIAAISAAIDSSEADRLDDLGEELKKAVAALGSRHGLTGGVESGVSR